MNLRPTLFLIAAAASLELQMAHAQGSGYGASIRGKMHIPTESECIDALNAGQVLGVGRDGRLMVAKGDTVYWLEITPTYLDCEAAKFPPKAD